MPVITAKTLTITGTIAAQTHSDDDIVQVLCDEYGQLLTTQSSAGKNNSCGWYAPAHFAADDYTWVALACDEWGSLLTKISGENPVRETTSHILASDIEGSLEYDGCVGPLVTIDVVRQDICDGQYFNAFTSSAANDGDTVNIFLTTANSWVYPHMKPRMEVRWGCGGAAYMTIYEGPTIIANTGTSAVIYNKNRSSTRPSWCANNLTIPVTGSYSTGVTKTADGTIIHREYSGGAKSHSEGEIFWMLKAGTTYLFEVESAVSGSVGSIELNWHDRDATISRPLWS